MKTLEHARESETNSRFRVPPPLMTALAAGLMLGSIFLMRDLYGSDPIAAAPAGAVQSVETAAPFERRGIVSWLIGEQPIDRVVVTTDKGRYMVSGVGGYTEAAPVEVRETVSGARQLCVIGGAQCRDLWGDQSDLVATSAQDKQFSQLFKLATILAALGVVGAGVVGVLRTIIR